MNRYASGVGSDGYEIFVHVTMFCFFLSVYEIFFFFSSRRRHTRLQGDWISDVCSSDLLVIRDRVATSIGAFQAPGALYPRLLLFQSAPIAPHTTQEIETAAYEELDRLQREPPTDYEIQRVRNQIEASSVQRLQSNIGLAFQLSSSEALWYDWRRTFRDQAAQARVTAADVQRVAKTYFDKSNRTVATLVRPAQAQKGGND